MKRLLEAISAIGALAVLVVGAAGCNGQWSPYAARVNGSSISVGQLNSALSGVANDAGYACLLNQSSQGRLRIHGAAAGSYDVVFADFVLTNLIESELLTKRAAALHLQLPATARTVATAQVTQRLSQQLSTYPTCHATGGQILSSFGSSYRNDIVDFQLAQDAIAAHLAGTSLDPSDLQAYELRNPALTSQYCTSVIEVKSKSTAASLSRQIAAGAAFATVASKHSIDSASAAAGGAIGCVLASALVAPLGTVVAHLGVGHVSQPVKFQADWLLLSVTKRQLEPLDQLVAQLFGSEQTPFQKDFRTVLRQASVQVAQTYGHWDAAFGSGAGGVVQPSAPKSQYVPNPSGAVGTTSAPAGGPGLGGTGSAGSGPTG